MKLFRLLIIVLLFVSGCSYEYKTVPVTAVIKGVCFNNTGAILNQSGETRHLKCVKQTGRGEITLWIREVGPGKSTHYTGYPPLSQTAFYVMDSGMVEIGFMRFGYSRVD